ncbi:MAG: electron transfer flavoprotein-ubiquinone oxidoreductase [Geminicoccaceae bacterium]
MEREQMEFDAVIVGAGPAGLAAAIRLRQLAEEKGRDVSVCVLEKGSEVGAHNLSGAVVEPRALNEMSPDCKDKGAPLKTPAKDDHFLFLTEKKSFRLPTPPTMHNEGNYIISLGNLCRWLAEQAEAAGVEIYPGFAAAETLYGDDGQIVGVATGDMGVGRDGQPGPGYQPGMELRAKVTLFAEGCRGSLTKLLIERHDLRRDSDPQTYAIGIKELWEIEPDRHEPGRIVHTIGWPLDRSTYGGSFLYHLEENQVSVGFVIGLDYTNPWLGPYDEFQRFKHHPAIAGTFAGARRISYGARALNEGGFQSVPKLSVDGGMILGCGAGFMNVPKIKGSHTAMKSGMIAAETAFDAIAEGQPKLVHDYGRRIEASWIWPELNKVRNIRPAFNWGFWAGLGYSAIDTYVFRGHAPWTFHHHADHEQLKPAADARPIDYPKPDGVISFDKLTSVSLSATNHEEDQPIHLTLGDPSIAIDVNYQTYASPETRYCPAGVYEIVEEQDGPRLQINAQNCVHCKTCDIKDPTQNIHWVTPEGGGGPNYPNM